MATRRIRLILRKNSKLHKIATLLWRDNENSLYLTLNKVRDDKGIGKFEVKRGKWKISFADELDKTEIDHSSVKMSGVSHFRPKQKEQKSIAREEGVTLRNLRVARPLWTIVPRISDDAVYKKEPLKEDLVLDEPARIKGRALYLIAFPKQNLDLRFSDQINKNGSIPDFGFFSFPLDYFVVVLILHSNDRMIEPKRTLNIPAIRNHSAWVDTITSTKALGRYMKII